MEVGGNAPMIAFLKQHGVDPRNTKIEEKYKTVQCVAYRILLRAKALNKPVPDDRGALKAGKQVLISNKWDLDAALENAISLSTITTAKPVEPTKPVETPEEKAAREAAAATKAAEMAARAEAAKERKLKVQEAIKQKATGAGAKSSHDRLMAFYQKHDPEKATEERVQTAIQKYKGNEAKMWAILNQKYLKNKNDVPTTRPDRADTVDSLDELCAEADDARARSGTVDSIDALCAEAGEVYDGEALASSLGAPLLRERADSLDSLDALMAEGTDEPPAVEERDRAESADSMDELCAAAGEDEEGRERAESLDSLDALMAEGGGDGAEEERPRAASVDSMDELCAEAVEAELDAEVNRDRAESVDSMDELCAQAGQAGEIAGESAVGEDGNASDASSDVSL